MANVDCVHLCEYTCWGAVDRNLADDSNPRLDAYFAAAGPGATLRRLLASIFDDPGHPRGNSAACAYANGITLDQRMPAGPAEVRTPLRGPAKLKPASPQAPP